MQTANITAVKPINLIRQISTPPHFIQQSKSDTGQTGVGVYVCVFVGGGVTWVGVLGGGDVTISQVTKVCILKQKIYTVTGSEIIHTRSIQIHDLKPYQLGHKNWHTPTFIFFSCFNTTMNHNRFHSQPNTEMNLD